MNEGSLSQNSLLRLPQAVVSAAMVQAARMQPPGYKPPRHESTKHLLCVLCKLFFSGKCRKNPDVKLGPSIGG